MRYWSELKDVPHQVLVSSMDGLHYKLGDGRVLYTASSSGDAGWILTDHKFTGTFARVEDSRKNALMEALPGLLVRAERFKEQTTDAFWESLGL